MDSTYDVYNLEDSIDSIIEELSCECDKPDTFIRECYEALSEREGFIDYARKNDDSLFCSCLYDLVCRRSLSNSRLAGAHEEAKRYGLDPEKVLEDFDIETLDESIDNAIYNNYGIEAKGCLSPEFMSTMVSAEATYEHFGVARDGKKVLFKGFAPADVFEEE